MMSRKWARWTASVCLVPFLFANTHANTAIAVYLQGLPHYYHPHDGHDCLPEGESHSEDSPCPCHDDPADSSCPGCPKGPSDHSCPCPGGCAFCNVAKVSC